MCASVRERCVYKGGVEGTGEGGGGGRFTVRGSECSNTAVGCVAWMGGNDDSSALRQLQRSE